MSNDVHIYKAIKMGERERVSETAMNNNNSRISNKIPSKKCNDCGRASAK